MLPDSPDISDSLGHDGAARARTPMRHEGDGERGETVMTSMRIPQTLLCPLPLINKHFTCYLVLYHIFCIALLIVNCMVPMFNNHRLRVLIDPLSVFCMNQQWLVYDHIDSTEAKIVDECI